jgi:hypothetical protein
MVDLGTCLTVQVCYIFDGMAWIPDWNQVRSNGWDQVWDQVHDQVRCNVCDHLIEGVS